MKYKFNLGRNCLRIIIKTYGIKEIFIPYYSCPVLAKAAREENCRVKFYHIDQNFMPIANFGKDDFILYINYFGLFEHNVNALTPKYKNLIVDNTQSFYSQPSGLASFNSLRKFFPVANGAYLFMNIEQKLVYPKDNCVLPKASIRSNYELFKANECFLNNEGIKIISDDVEKYMSGIDFESDKNIRRILFKKYCSAFNDYNLIKLPELGASVPYCYPFCPNNSDIVEKFRNFTILRLWDNLPKSFNEYEFLNNVAALPLTDRNYTNELIKTVESL